MLTEEGVATPGGKTNWQVSKVRSILTNEKYKGDALIQKRFTVDFLTKEMKINEGEVQSYYVNDSHPAIIDKAEWELVQIEFEKRKRIGRNYSGGSIFSSKLICGDCGGFFGSKVWHSTDKYRKVIWQCNGKFNKEVKCATPHLDDESIKQRFLTAINSIIANRASVLEDCRLIQHTLTDCSVIDAELNKLNSEIEVVTELTRRCIEENSSLAQDQSEYIERYNALVDRYETAKTRAEELQAAKSKCEAKADVIGAFVAELEKQDGIIREFDMWLWIASIEKTVVHRDGRLVFYFQNGMKIEA